MVNCARATVDARAVFAEVLGDRTSVADQKMDGLTTASAQLVRTVGVTIVKQRMA